MATKKTVRQIALKLPKQTTIPRVLHLAIVATQLYELVLVVEHVSLITVSAALILLVILAANKKGTEDHTRA